MGESVRNRFIGSFDYSIDTKGRINMPARFRKALSAEAEETFVISYAPNNRLRVYPLDEWTKIEESYANLPQTPENVRLQRVIFETLSESELDAQGRITLSQKQIKYAQLEKSVTLVGLSFNRCIEICATQNILEVSDEEITDLYYQSMGAKDE